MLPQVAAMLAAALAVMVPSLPKNLDIRATFVPLRLGAPARS
jgi:hypothetical protein